MMDHKLPTVLPDHQEGPIAREQLETLECNCREYGVVLYRLTDLRQGIVHIVGLSRA